jgi:hypothetical protein
MMNLNRLGTHELPEVVEQNKRERPDVPPEGSMPSERIREIVVIVVNPR